MDLINLANNNQSPDCSMDCGKNYLPLISCDCFGTLGYTYKTVEEILAGNCDTVHTCINTQLGLVNAGALTNFNQASVNAIVDYFSQSGVQAPTAAEVCAYLSSLPQNITIDSTTKLILGSCEYGTVGDLSNYLKTTIKHTINGEIGTATLNPDDSIKFMFDNIVTNIEVDEIVPTIINVKIPTKMPYVKALENPTANIRTTIIHNLNTPVPSLYAYDSANEYIDIERKFVDDNTIEYRVTTNNPFTYYIKS